MKEMEDKEYAASEGREFLKLITEVNPDEIDEKYEDWEIIAWLEEMDYEWNGASWVAA